MVRSLQRNIPVGGLAALLFTSPFNRDERFSSISFNSGIHLEKIRDTNSKWQKH